MMLYRTLEDIQQYIRLDECERDWFISREKKNLSLDCRVPDYYLKLIADPADREDPIRRQCIPTTQEFHTSSWELTDPLGEERYTATPRLIHRYPGRALFLAADTCMMYCRFCFRRRFTSRGSDHVTTSEIDAAAAYLAEHQEIRELLISGGDPLTLGTEELNEMIARFRFRSPSVVVRICTRFPAVYPMGVTDQLVHMLAAWKPLYIITQFNHPREVTRDASAALERCIDSGLPVLNQSVLLRGINDTPDILEQLMHILIGQRVIPYYLFQGDLAVGTAHFRVSLRQGLQIVKELGRRISGLAMPRYAVDLPGGGGKVLLEETALVREENGLRTYMNSEGDQFTYPMDEHERQLDTS